MIMKCIVLAAPVLIVSIVKEDLKPAANAGASELFIIIIPAGAAGEFSSPGSTFCADSYFGIRSTPVLPQ